MIVGGEAALARCRTAGAAASAGNETEAESLAPSPHQRLIHALQAADPHDAWLQAEWAESALAAAAAAAAAGGGEEGGRGATAAAAAAAATTTTTTTDAATTAAKHFEVAGLLLLREVSLRTGPPPSSSDGGGPQHRVLHPDPQAWSEDDDDGDDGADNEDDDDDEDDEQAPAVPLPLALRSAALFLLRRLELFGDQEEDPARCPLHQRMCHAHFHLAALLASERATTGGNDKAAAASAAVRDGVSCARSLKAACPAHAEELRRAVRF
jgi:hypothetical protein